jgi:hypothetical protein
MLQILSHRSKIFTKGYFYFPESYQPLSLSSFTFDNTIQNTNQNIKKVLITSFDYLSEYNYTLLLASYKGSVGAFTIAAQLLEKTAIISDSTIQNVIKTILVEINNLDNFKDDLENLIEKYQDQSRQIYVLGNLLKKHYTYLNNIEQTKKICEYLVSTSTSGLNEYFEYFNDCYKALMDKFLQLNDFCHKYNDNSQVNLVQLLTGSSDLIASNLIIDHTCEIKIREPSKLIQQLDTNIIKKNNNNNNNDIALIYIKNNILHINIIDHLENDTLYKIDYITLEQSTK